MGIMGRHGNYGYNRENEDDKARTKQQLQEKYDKGCVKCGQKFGWFTHKHKCRKCDEYHCHNCTHTEVPGRSKGESTRCRECGKQNNIDARARARAEEQRQLEYQKHMQEEMRADMRRKLAEEQARVDQLVQRREMKSKQRNAQRQHLKNLGINQDRMPEGWRGVTRNQIHNNRPEVQELMEEMFDVARLQ